MTRPISLREQKGMRVRNTISKLIVTSAIIAASLSSVAESKTLDDIRKRDYVSCAVNNDAFGLGYPNKNGISSGMSADICGAIAIAVFGDSSKKRITHITSIDQLVSMSSGNYDVLIRSTEITMARDSFLGIRFTNIWFYDSQRIVVMKSSGVNQLKDLDGATMCLNQGNNTEIALSDLFRKNKMQMKVVVMSDAHHVAAALAQSRCDALSTGGMLTVQALRPYAESVKMLDESFDVKNYGIAVKNGDDEWFNLVRWVFNTLLLAEEHGINSSNIDEKASDPDPNAQRLLRKNPDTDKRLGTREGWVEAIIRTYGNYGEIYHRHIGAFEDKFNLPPRGMNRLCKDGGRHCPIPLQ